MQNFGYSSKVLTAFAFFTMALLIAHCSQDEKKKPKGQSENACGVNTSLATSYNTGTVTSITSGTATTTTTATSTDTSLSLSAGGFGLAASPTFAEVTSKLNEIYRHCEGHNRPKARKIDCADYDVVSSKFDEILDDIADIRPTPDDDLAFLRSWNRADPSSSSSTYTYSSTSTSTSGLSTLNNLNNIPQVQPNCY